MDADEIYALEGRVSALHDELESVTQRLESYVREKERKIIEVEEDVILLRTEVARVDTEIEKGYAKALNVAHGVEQCLKTFKDEAKQTWDGLADDIHGLTAKLAKDQTQFHTLHVRTTNNTECMKLLNDLQGQTNRKLDEIRSWTTDIDAIVKEQQEIREWIFSQQMSTPTPSQYRHKRALAEEMGPTHTASSLLDIAGPDWLDFQREPMVSIPGHPTEPETTKRSPKKQYITTTSCQPEGRTRLYTAFRALSDYTAPFVQNSSYVFATWQTPIEALYSRWKSPAVGLAGLGCRSYVRQLQARFLEMKRKYRIRELIGFFVRPSQTGFALSNLRLLFMIVATILCALTALGLWTSKSRDQAEHWVPEYWSDGDRFPIDFV
ncbi:hypothetical protein CPB83DRAFT_900932 [Crepidotus variabilis]|uniref:Uncharacterized protein n=1 Tax=Crepidotus variabilis TaxID=179855 RepID=A0A9P6E059_9AGAR|nr:hypothetical protein CPB83DRAFT_900932 [Crepidotus variabilis]